MREIKFRGKSTEEKNNGQWVYGFYREFKPIDGTNYFIDTKGMNESFFINPETVGQYTGLKDKDGTEIYEGDITRLVLSNGEERFFKVSIKYVNRYLKSHPNFEGEWAKVGVMGVVFEWRGYELYPCVDENGVADNVKMEVVGNVHDNPELLEAQDE